MLSFLIASWQKGGAGSVKQQVTTLTTHPITTSRRAGISYGTQCPQPFLTLGYDFDPDLLRERVGLDIEHLFDEVVKASAWSAFLRDSCCAIRTRCSDGSQLSAEHMIIKICFPLRDLSVTFICISSLQPFQAMGLLLYQAPRCSILYKTECCMLSLIYNIWKCHQCIYILCYDPPNTWRTTCWRPLIYKFWLFL